MFHYEFFMLKNFLPIPSFMQHAILNRCCSTSVEVIICPTPCTNFCPRSISIALINTITKINLGKRVYTYSPQSQSIMEEVRARTQAGTWRQALKQRPWRSAVYWLALHGLLGLLSYRTQDHLPRAGLTHYVLSPPTLITN